MKEQFYSIHHTQFSVNFYFRLFALVLLLNVFLDSHAQVKLGDNPNTINASSLLELESTNKALLLSRLTTVQMNAVATPVNGMLIYNTDSATLYYYDATQWVMLQGVTATWVIDLIASNARNAPLSDSIWNAMLGHAHNLTAGSGAISVTGGQGSTFKDVTVDVNRDSLVSYVFTSPLLTDSVIAIIADNSGKSPLRDSIFSTVLAQGRNVTGASPVRITGGTGASLQNMSIGLDSAALAVILSQHPASDTILSVVSESAKNLSAGSGAITVTGGQGATLQNVTIDVNKDSLVSDVFNSPLLVDSIVTIVADNTGTSPLRDSIFSTVTAHGRNVTGTSPVVVTGGVGASLQNVSVGIDSAALAIIVSAHPVSDTIVSIVSENAHNITAGSGVVTVTGGIGASLQNVSIDVNKDSLVIDIFNSPLLTDSIISIVADNSGTSPLRDSIFSTVSAQGRNVTGTLPVVVTGGMGATLQNVNVGLDSAALALVIALHPVSDTILNIVSENARNITAGSTLITVTGGIGASLQNVNVDVNKDTLVNVVLNSPLLGDTILNILSADAHNIIAGSSAVTIAGGVGAALQNVTVDVNKDTLANYILNSPLLTDSILQVLTDDARNITAGSGLITVTGGLGASLQTVNLDVNRDTLVNIVLNSPLLGDTILQVLADDAHNIIGGSGLITVTGGLGASLQNVNVDVNRDTLVNVVLNSPLLSDSIIHVIADNSRLAPLSDSIFSTVAAQGRNLTGSSAILISGGAGAGLQNVNVGLDSNILAQIIGASPVSDSIISILSGRTKNLLGSPVVTVTGGIGASLQDVNIGIDSSALAVVISEHPIRDTVVSIVAQNGRNLSAGSGAITVTGGIGSTLQNISLDVNRDTLVNIVASETNVSPLRDSIYASVVEHSHGLGSSTPAITITGGVNTTLQSTTINVDSLQLIDLLLRSHVMDSLVDMRGFNVDGTTTNNSFLSLTLSLANNPDTVTAYQLQSLTDTTVFPSFNQGVYNTGAPSYFTAPVTGYYSLTFAANFTVNPSLASVGGVYTWGIAIIKTNGTPTVIQSSRTSQTLSSSVLGLGASTAGANSITTLVKLNAGDTVGVGVGAINGLTLGVLSSTSLSMRFSGYLVR